MHKVFMERKLLLAELKDKISESFYSRISEKIEMEEKCYEEFIVRQQVHEEKQAKYSFLLDETYFEQLRIEV